MVLKGGPLAEDESKPAVNLQLDGKWKWTKTGLSNTPGLPMNTEKGTAVFEQSGKDVRIVYSKRTRVKGVLDGNTLTYGRSHTSGSATISETVKIAFDSNRSAKGIGNWEIKNKGGGMHEYVFQRLSE